MFEVLNEGGPFMYVIAAAAVVVLALALERGFVLWVRYRLDPDAFLAKVILMIEQGDSFSSALQLCAGSQHPVARVIHAGIMKANRSDKEIERTLEEAAVKEIPKVTRRSSYIAVIANVATLLGLLGTIFGLMKAFEAVGAASAAEKQTRLAQGIAVAMLTTAAGLIVAIPSLLLYAFISARQTRVVEAIEEVTLGFFNFISTRNRMLREEGPPAAADEEAGRA